MWRSGSRCERRVSFLSRVLALLTGRRDRRTPPWLGADPDDPFAGAGVREPRRPLTPTLFAAAEPDLPDD